MENGKPAEAAVSGLKVGVLCVSRASGHRHHLGFVEYAVALAVRQDPQRGFVVVFIGLSFILSGSSTGASPRKKKVRDTV